jgi:hypothetical protein
MEAYSMSWREFQLRAYAYMKNEQNDWYKVREVAYASIIGSHMNPKKIPKSKEAFMALGIGGTKKKVNDAQKQAFLNAYKKYLDERKVKV